MGEKIVMEWGKNLGKRKVGLEMSLVEDGVAGKKRKVVVFVVEGGGKVEGGRYPTPFILFLLSLFSFLFPSLYINLYYLSMFGFIILVNIFPSSIVDLSDVDHFETSF